MTKKHKPNFFVLIFVAFEKIYKRLRQQLKSKQRYLVFGLRLPDDETKIKETIIYGYYQKICNKVKLKEPF